MTMKRITSRNGWPVIFAVVVVTGALAIAAFAMRAEASMNFANGLKVWGPFEDYWKANGGLFQLGQPLTGVYQTTDGYAAQFFERAVLVYDPKALPASSVQAEPVGWMAAANLCTQPAFARVSSSGRGQYFQATGHNVSGAFLDYWKAHNGLAAYGYPLSEPFTQRLGDGNDYQVQYFERARFELHGTVVMLGLLGRDALTSQGGASIFANLTAPAFYPAPNSPSNGTRAPVPTAQQHRLGHAPDYSWIAGRIDLGNPPAGSRAVDRPTLPPRVFTASNLDPVVPPAPMPTPLPNGAIVGTASHSDTSPPLRDIQPRPPIAECSPQAGYIFMPTGRGWDPSKVRDGQYVILYGHLAAPGEVAPMGDQGRVYVVDRMQVGP